MTEGTSKAQPAGQSAARGTAAPRGETERAGRVPPAPSPVSRRAALGAGPPAWLVDGLVLSIVVGLSLALYTGGLGFYFDDWGFLGIMATAATHSFGDLWGALWSEDVVIRQRPVQMFYLASMYRLFGLDPLPYHVFNGVMLLAAALLLYALLRELRQPRLLALAVPAVYVTMPNFASDRFWIAAHQTTISVVLFLAAAYATLRALRAGRPAFVLLTVLAVLAYVGSGLAYELTLPLFVVAAALAVYQARRLRDEGFGERPVWRLRVLVPATLASLVALIVFKAVVTVRVHLDESRLEYARNLLIGPVRVNLGYYGIGLPYVLSWIARHAFDPAVVVVGLAAGVVIALALYRVGRDEVERRETRNRRTLYVVGGLVVFVLGYLVFAVPTDLRYGPASFGNRVWIAAALGVAALFAGVAAWVASALARVLSRTTFAVLIGALCASGIIVTNTLARFWTSAYREQERITAAMRRDLPALRPGSAVILDGVCLQRGGAWALTGRRDVTGWLWVQHGTRELRGSAVTNPPQIGARGVTLTTLALSRHFPYGDRLLFYNAARGTTHPLTSERVARAYFARSGFDPRECPAGFSWRGPAQPID